MLKEPSVRKLKINKGAATYEPSWGVDCRPNLIRLIAKGYAQIVSDVLVDVSDVSEVLLTGLSSLAIS